MEYPDRAPKERYYDPEFYRLETERLWSRTWQMACRLEEIPQPYDFAEYEILDQSVDRRAHRRRRSAGVPECLPAPRCQGRAGPRVSCPSGFTCPFHGWCYGPDGKNTLVTRRADLQRAQPRIRRTSTSCRCSCETWGGCAWINLDDDRSRRCASASSRSPPCSTRWKLESMRAEWWYACRLPVNWKIAEEAFMEQYHVLESHPQLRIPGRMVPRPGKPFDRRRWLDGELQYLHTMSDGMAGMVHANDVAIAEGLRDIELPAEPRQAMRDLAAHAQRRGRELASSGRRRRSPTSTSSRRGASAIRCTTASRTSSCCRCTAARRPTASARSARKRR